MTSGNFHILPIDEITINREGRQRTELVKIEELADSIRRLGLIHPIVVTRSSELVTGERRYTACKSLGWTTIPIQYQDELDPATLTAIELEENIKRQDIPWQDQVNAIHKYHTLRSSENPDWSQSDTAAAIGLSRPHTHRMLHVHEEVMRGNPLIIKAKELSTAVGIAERARERRDQQVLGKLHETLGTVEVPEAPPETILTADFTEWTHLDMAVRFNFFHCDFPYGIEADSFAQGGAKAHGGYEDTRDTWDRLMLALDYATRKIAAPSAHLMFWFAMRKGDERLYEMTARNLEQMGWRINPQPLIWMKSDGAGILPDPERGPRQVYETCFLGSRGDRKIVRAVANAYHSPSVRDTHMSVKPEPMLRHFFGMLVDQNTVMLDPTCGSGSSVRAAESLGAKYCLGLEVNPDFAALAREDLKKMRSLRKLEAVLSKESTP